MLYNIRYTQNRDRELALNYLGVLQQQAQRPLRVLDVGGWHNQWAPQFVTAVIDIHEVPGVNLYTGNINMPYIWQELEEVVKKEGLFDFCICTHTLEDVANPRLPLEFMPKIAKEGFIAIPSKYAEMRRSHLGFRGSIHHRWIYNKEDLCVVAYPKVGFIEYENDVFDEIATKFDDSNEELQFFWRGSIEVNFMNDDYLGPSDHAVMGYYTNLLDL